MAEKDECKFARAQSGSTASALAKSRVLKGSVSANNALTISLFDNTADGIKKIATFSPRFTYPIFGEDEHIFGYKDLKISLQYDATSMRPHIRISSRQKFKAVGDTEPADLKGILREHLPPGKYPPDKGGDGCLFEGP